MDKFRKIIFSPLIGSVVFLIVLIILFCFYGFGNRSLELFIGIYGAFVATLLGIYISLYYTREQTREQEAKSTEKIMVGSLKLLWSELDLNSKSLDNLIKGYKTMPKVHEALYENFTFLSTYSEGIKFDVFYGLISSGDMSEISKDDEIFNALQQAYYNTELMLNGITMTGLVYKDFSKNQKINSTDIEVMWGLLEQEIGKGERTLDMVHTAKKIIQKYLSALDVTFNENGNPLD